jgi:hypothetical protein
VICRFRRLRSFFSVSCWIGLVASTAGSALVNGLALAKKPISYCAPYALVRDWYTNPAH